MQTAKQIIENMRQPVFATLPIFKATAYEIFSSLAFRWVCTQFLQQMCNIKNTSTGGETKGFVAIKVEQKDTDTFCENSTSQFVF